MNKNPNTTHNILQKIPRTLLNEIRNSSQIGSIANEHLPNYLEPIINSDDNDDIEFVASAMFPIQPDEPELADTKNLVKTRLTDGSQTYNLFRTTAKPISQYYDKKLEELSFVSIFPYGSNGYREAREAPFFSLA